MKKLAIGCGVVVVLVGVVGAGISYYVYRQVRATVAQFAELGQVPEIERGVRNRSAFTPPASGDLTRDQIERLVRVQATIRDHLGDEFAELEARYKTLIEREQANALDLPQIVAMYRDLAGTWLAAKRRQVEALNDVGFSLDEYRWVREQAYTALGLPFLEVDVARLVDDIREGRTSREPGELKGALGPGGSGANATLIAGFRKQLEDNVALASLGL